MTTTPGPPDGAPIRVLLVDDSEDLRLVVRQALARNGGFDVVGEASDGASAVEAARATQPDIVLLDLAMPGVDGFAALPLLRAEVPAAKVVVLSGLPPAGAEQRARSAGAVGFLEKGIPPRRLVDELLAVASLIEIAQLGITKEQSRFDRDASAPRAARRFVDATLRRWECAAALEHIELMVAELVTNAVIHAGSEPEVAVILRRDAIRVEVADASTVPPRPRQPDVDGPGGRGLHLVEAFSDAWGVEVLDDGKVVWFEVPRLDVAPLDVPQQEPTA